MRLRSVRIFDGALWGYSFDCPGCGDRHSIPTEPTAGDRAWGFNGDVERPTFTPSISVRYFAVDPDDTEARQLESVCHSFVENGRIRFLSDCTHALANQTVDLPDMPAQTEAT